MKLSFITIFVLTLKRKAYERISNGLTADGLLLVFMIDRNLLDRCISFHVERGKYRKNPMHKAIGIADQMDSPMLVSFGPSDRF